MLRVLESPGIFCKQESGNFDNSEQTCLHVFTEVELASCLMYAPKWASANFVDNLCPFWHSFGCVLLLNQIFLIQCTIRQYTTPIYLISLLWKLGLGLGLDSELHYFSIFRGE